MTDLIAIKARIRNAYMDFKGDDRAFYAALGDVKNLLAEVEALRAEQAETRAALESYHLGDLTVRDALKRYNDLAVRARPFAKMADRLSVENKRLTAEVDELRLRVKREKAKRRGPAAVEEPDVATDTPDGFDK